VGGIGIMNIMLVSVTERTQEMDCVRRSVPQANILIQFIIEADAQRLEAYQAPLGCQWCSAGWGGNALQAGFRRLRRRRCLCLWRHWLFLVSYQPVALPNSIRLLRSEVHKMKNSLSTPHSLLPTPKPVFSSNISKIYGSWGNRSPSCQMST